MISATTASGAAPPGAGSGSGALERAAHGSDALERAARAAADAATAAGVTVRTVGDLAGVLAVTDFLAETWGTPPGAPPLPADVLISAVHAGGAVHAAYAGDRLVGAAVLVFKPPAERAVYSLVAAAATSDRGVGLAVKQAQRLWSLERGAERMQWTFDPLLGRNARFNLVKLGGLGTEYVVDFYGRLDDGFNGGDESDRLTVTWDLCAPRHDVDDGTAGRAGAEVVRRAPDGAPLALRSGERWWCRVPGDVLALRAKDMPLALRWRHAVREVFTEAFADGYEASAFSRDGWYLLTRSRSASGTPTPTPTPTTAQEG
ncbi:chorismate synthase [Streptomyces sp. LHD-70]|uniref:chorismate synthase n=1 Tax=Streptomyces sp. LHD-70 TaxID=3072140 RepID=UPI00280DD277|nr:chorismate synthase [Streptomyces sp. LHD-70]MDQ8708034.1 chorismate synthase [Streptomyces sp. LHD-70]